MILREIDSVNNDVKKIHTKRLENFTVIQTALFVLR